MKEKLTLVTSPSQLRIGMLVKVLRALSLGGRTARGLLLRSIPNGKCHGNGEVHMSKSLWDTTMATNRKCFDHAIAERRMFIIDTELEREGEVAKTKTRRKVS